ncbi:MAG: polysaccharide biosynthesis C-terminal domain-containing protein, partial [Oscillospiraceae bacterium]|nr:polysaccharide biosynthesis C-terminal domain-containing protein [Oscillospiraceae bacterium]
ALPYAAAGALLAVSLSELCGLITLIIADKKRKTTEAPPVYDMRRRDICLKLIRETAPIAAGALVMNCVSFADLLTVTRSISDAVASDPEYFDRAFSGILASAGGAEGLPNFMYGSYTGIATALFMLIPSFAGMTEKTFAPEIAAAWERQNLEQLSGRIFMQFRSAAVIGCPACFGAAALAQPILTMLYKSRAAEVSVCLNSFIILCMGGLFMVTASAMFGIFQAICKAHIPLILMICSVAAKLILNPILISIPSVNISGAALSSAAGYVLMTVMGAAAMKRCIPVKISLAKAVIPPALCGIACGVGAYFAHLMLKKRFDSVPAVLISVGIGAILYV